MHRQMNQGAADTRNNPRWDPDSVSAIPTQSRQSQEYTAATRNQLQNHVLPTYMAPEETEID